MWSGTEYLYISKSFERPCQKQKRPFRPNEYREHSPNVREKRGGTIGSDGSKVSEKRCGNGSADGWTRL